MGLEGFFASVLAGVGAGVATQKISDVIERDETIPEPPAEPRLPDPTVLDAIEALLVRAFERAQLGLRAKGESLVMFERAQVAARLSDRRVDCRGYNAIRVACYASGTTPSAVISIEGADAGGGNYLPLADPRYSRTVTADAAFDVAVGADFVKVRLASVTGTFAGGQGFQVVVTPYVAGAQPDTVAGGHTTRISVTPTISTSAYTAGDAVGGLLTFTNAARRPGGSGIVQSVTIVDLDQERRELDLVLFNQSFTNTADNDPFDPSNADLANVVGHVKILSADYINFNDNSLATVANVGLPFVLGADRNLYGQLVTREGQTYTATNDIQVILGILQD